MTLRKEVIVVCDDCGTEYRIEKNSYREAEKQVRENGWNKSGDNHICEMCQEQESEESDEE